MQQSLRDLLVAHGSVCGECLVRHAKVRSESVYRALEGHAITEGRCGVRTVDGPVFTLDK